MNRMVITAVVGMLAKALFFTILAGIGVVAIGYWQEWQTSLAYSNAFFIAGCLMIIAGASSRLGAGQEWGTFQSLHAESFRDMSRAERANYIIEVSSSFHLFILGLLSGIFLIAISVLITKMV